MSERGEQTRAVPAEGSGRTRRQNYVIRDKFKRLVRLVLALDNSADIKAVVVILYKINKMRSEHAHAVSLYRSAQNVKHA